MGESTMNPDLLKRLQVNGVGPLPWERTGIQTEEQWEVAAGCVKLQAIARDDDDEPFGCKILKLEEGFWERVGGKALGWDDAPYHAFVDELEEKFWPAYRMYEAKQRNLPRLSHLPDDLRAVAEEFLTLNGAWDTAFHLFHHPDEKSYFYLRWGGSEEVAYSNATVTLEATGRVDLRAGNYDKTGDPDFYHCFEARSNKPRHSHDFAEFVKRFRLEKSSAGDGAKG